MDVVEYAKERLEDFIKNSDSFDRHVQFLFSIVSIDRSVSVNILFAKC